MDRVALPWQELGSLCHTGTSSMEELEGKGDAYRLPGFCHTTGAASLWKLAAAHDRGNTLFPETETIENPFSTFLFFGEGVDG